MEEEVANNNRAKKIPVTKKYISVEYPGNVVNPNNAIATLGGMEELCRIHENEEPVMKLNFRPDHWSSHPLYGDRSSVNNLLLRVRIPRNKEKKVESEIVGIVPVSFQFKGLSDMQCLFPLPIDESPVNDSGEINFDAPHANSVEIVPRVFFKVDHQQPYNFEKNPSFMFDKSQSKWVRKPTTHPTKTSNSKVSHNIKVVPQPLETLPRLSADSKEIYDQVKKLFETRAVWLKDALELNIAKQFHARLRVILPLVAYCFQSGPFRSTWVRLGYDPRLDKDSRVYQVLDYRIKSQAYISQNQEAIEQCYQKKIKVTIPFIAQHKRQKDFVPDFVDIETEDNNKPKKKAKLSETVSQKNFTAKPPSITNFFQLIDVQIEELQKVIKQTTGVYNVKDGWYSKNTIKMIREIMNKKLLTFFEEAKEENKDVGDSDLRDSIMAPAMNESEDEGEEDGNRESDVDDEHEDFNKDNADENELDPNQNIEFLSQLMKNVAAGEADIDEDFLNESLKGIDALGGWDQNMDVEEFQIL